MGVSKDAKITFNVKKDLMKKGGIVCAHYPKIEPDKIIIYKANPPFVKIPNLLIPYF